MENKTSSEDNDDFLAEFSGEQLYIKQLERKLGRPIPLTDKVKRGEVGYEMEGNQIIGLSLYGCGLEAIPASINEATGLKKLYLRRNKINEIHNRIAFMESLEELDLSINELEKLPPSVGLLKNLKLLKLRSNKLRSLPKSLGNLSSLKMLDLTDNQLKEIPEPVKNLPNLTMEVAGNLLITLSKPEKKPKKKKQAKKEKLLEDFL